MIKFLKHSEIDKSRWDQCIDQSDEAIVYANSWYLDIVSPGWNALVAGDYNSVFPLTWRKKFGFIYLFQPVFTQQLGLFNAKVGDENILFNFLESIPPDYKLIEIQLNSGNSQLGIPASFRKIERLTHHLDLNTTEEELENNFSENTRRNIKRFNKSGWQIKKNITPENLVDLFRQNRGKDISQLKDKDYKAFLNICTEAKNRNLITILGAADVSGFLQAGIVFLKTHSGYILIFSALSNEGKENGAMAALIADFIRSQAGIKGILDFEGSMDPGIARFYKSFASHEIVYLQIINNRLPIFLRWLKN